MTSNRPFPYTRSRQNKVIQALRENGPMTTDDMDGYPNLSSAAKKFVGTLKPPWKSGTPIWYIWGDERRAIRLFVSVNEDGVREAMEQSNSTLRQRMDDSMWRLLCEEWMWSGKLTEEELERYRKEEDE